MSSTPAGTISLIISASLRIDQGVGLAGWMTVQFPAASAGEIFHAAIKRGKLKGMICSPQLRVVRGSGRRLCSCQFRRSPPVCADRAGKVAEVVNGER